MARYISFFVLSLIKIFSHIFFTLEDRWLNGRENFDWKNLRLIVFLNHTSLFEPLFLAAVPWKFLWVISKRLVAPGADITLERPFVGWLYRNLSTNIIPISRKRDDSWSEFMSLVNDDQIILILPEGRMKRANGLDKHGNPMSVRGGIADILSEVNEGDVLIAYSGGLHHVQVPGQQFPRLFKTIKLNIEHYPLTVFKDMIDNNRSENNFKLKVISELEARLKSNNPV